MCEYMFVHVYTCLCMYDFTHVVIKVIRTERSIIEDQKKIMRNKIRRIQRFETAIQSTKLKALPTCRSH